MKDLGITKGEWKSIFRNKHDRGIRSDKGFICFMTMPPHFPNQDKRYEEELDECRADAELITDAGNTAQKCGLLPSELLKQRDEMLADIEFLAKRQQMASAISFYGERDTGVSSNSIVSIAYGVTKLENQSFPSDLSDMMACENMWKKLPTHRKTGDGLTAMERARKCDYYGKEITNTEER